MELDVRDDEAEQRYELLADATVLGIAAYRRRPGLVAFTHTEVAEQLEGHGAGSKLVRFALDDARERGEAVLPFCPFVNGWIAKHPEYVDLVPEQQRGHFNL